MTVGKLKVWLWFAIMVGTVIGAGLVVTKEEMPVMPVVLGVIVYGFLIGIIFYFSGRSKVPNYDERNQHILRKFFAYTSTILLVILGLMILGLYLARIEEIEVGLLAVCFSIVYMILGIGSFIASKA
ncbi:hypothetical protein [Paenisporosarcina indica]|uniref:hypothetical protein n=1 Tax=Paenisporosarcina indica TaxID=650093 RepID=UPI00094F8D13|nr:hypothetical protein [Paenisporosarcina indica]